MKLQISSLPKIIFILFTNHQLQFYRQLNEFNTCTSTAGTSKISRLTARAYSRSVISSLFKVTLLTSAALNCLKSLLSQAFLAMYRSLSLDASTDSDVFYVEHSSAGSSPNRYNTPAILNSTQLSGAMEPEAITISSVASPEPQIVTIDSDSNEPTIPYAFGSQQLIVPPSLNDLNLPPNPFNAMATLAVFQQDQEDSPNHQSRLICLQYRRPQ